MDPVLKAYSHLSSFFHRLPQLRSTAEHGRAEPRKRGARSKGRICRESPDQRDPAQAQAALSRFQFGSLSGRQHDQDRRGGVLSCGQSGPTAAQKRAQKYRRSQNRQSVHVPADPVQQAHGRQDNKPVS